MSQRIAHARLHAVPTVVGPPMLPDPTHLSDETARRPGDLHELVVLGVELRRQVEVCARQVGLPTGITGRLLIEASLVCRDLAGLGVSDGPARLQRAARGAGVRRRLSAAEADYLRLLRRPPGFRRTLVTAPTRLIGRIAELDLSRAVGVDCRSAVAWEIASVLDGHTMLEWALAAVIRAT